jgi:hypothetical protein
VVCKTNKQTNHNKLWNKSCEEPCVWEKSSHGLCYDPLHRLARTILTKSLRLSAEAIGIYCPQAWQQKSEVQMYTREICSRATRKGSDPGLSLPCWWLSSAMSLLHLFYMCPGLCPNFPFFGIGYPMKASFKNDLILTWLSLFYIHFFIRIYSLHRENSQWQFWLGFYCTLVTSLPSSLINLFPNVAT